MFDKFKKVLHRHSISIASGAVVLVAVVGALLLVKDAQALTINNSPQSCFMFAMATKNLTVLRDAGLEWKDAEVQMKELLALVKGKPDSIIQDEEDMDVMMRTAYNIWHSEVTVDIMVAHAYEACQAMPKNAKKVSFRKLT